METGTVRERLCRQLEQVAQNRRLADLRIGLSYVGVKMDDGAAGIAALLPGKTSRGCTILQEAGAYAGSEAVEALKFLAEGKDVLHMALAMAVANALIRVPETLEEDREATTYFNLKPDEKVAMVGLFAPLVRRIQETGANLTVIERNPERRELLSPVDKVRALKECDVAIITATTLLNDTFEETIESLGSPRLVALIGPSTPLAPEIFLGTPVTHLGGAVVSDSTKVLQVISEAGGTPALRPYLRFVNLML